MADQDIAYIFTPPSLSSITLPINRNDVGYTATLIAGLSGSVSLSACFDKYGILWKWSTFETGNSAIPETSFTGLCALTATALQNTVFTFPSSWATTQCAFSAGSLTPDLFGPFSKKWTNEGPLSASLFNKSSICTVDTYTWTLCSDTGWSYTQTIPTSVSEQFVYILRLEQDGLIPNTVSERRDTNLLLNVKLTAQCFLSADGPNLSYIYPIVDLNYPFTSITPPRVRLYTPNRFVLTGVNINFENLITFPEKINRLEIDFDDGKVVSYLGNDIQKAHFTQSYETVGSKTLKATIYTDLYPTPYTETFSKIVQILDTYDQVSPTEYRINTEPIQLPWSSIPEVGTNDWVVEDNINNCFKKLYENLQYLETRGRFYPDTYSDYFGWLGLQPQRVNQLSGCEFWTWEDLDCFTSPLPYTVTWRDVLSGESLANSGSLIDCGTWVKQECGGSEFNPTCEGKYIFGNVCTRWNWRDRSTGALQLGTTPITWAQTKLGRDFQKRWFFEPCEITFQIVCDEGVWNVNINNIDAFYQTIQSPRVTSKCFYSGVASKNNNLFVAQKTNIRLLSSDYSASFYNAVNQIDDIQTFSDIKNICLDSSNKIFVLDSLLNQVIGFLYSSDQPRTRLDIYTSWGGFGTAKSTNRFSNPNDIHIDQFDNVWITDTGNGCVKLYSNTGSWIRTITDSELVTSAPLSLCIDSNQNVHILTDKEIRIYTYTGDFLYGYSYKEYLNTQPFRITSSFNREIIYVATKDQVIKFFKNGAFAGYIIKQQEGVSNITGIYHDEFRNLLISVDNKILKYPDIMTISRIKGILPSNYWSLNDIYIHKEEYIQNWVYTKAFQRMWDNIELFRNTLQFTEFGCKVYIPPIYAKDKMAVGQNEIVTASTVNRVLGYLWDNFTTLLNYFDPNCVDKQFTLSE